LVLGSGIHPSNIFRYFHVFAGEDSNSFPSPDSTRHPEPGFHATWRCYQQLIRR
jgi:hypothetical protein